MRITPAGRFKRAIPRREGYSIMILTPNGSDNETFKGRNSTENVSNGIFYAFIMREDRDRF